MNRLSAGYYNLGVYGPHKNDLTSLTPVLIL